MPSPVMTLGTWCSGKISLAQVFISNYFHNVSLSKPKLSILPEHIDFSKKRSYEYNKKIVLRERKRHTAHRVKSKCSLCCCLRGRGYPIQSWPGEVPHQVLSPGWGGGLSHLVLVRGYPSSPGGGVPHLVLSPGWGYPIQSWPGG